MKEESLQGEKEDRDEDEEEEEKCYLEYTNVDGEDNVNIATILSSLTSSKHCVNLKK